MEASVAIQVLPTVLDDEEVCRIVDEVIAYIAEQGYNYYVGPFETTIVKISYKPEGEVLSIEKKIGKYHE